MSDRLEANDLDAVEARLRGLRPRGASLDVDAILAAGLRPTTNATGPLHRPRRLGLAVASWLGGVATGGRGHAPWALARGRSPAGHGRRACTPAAADRCVCRRHTRRATGLATGL